MLSLKPLLTVVKFLRRGLTVLTRTLVQECPLLATTGPGNSALSSLALLWCYDGVSVSFYFGVSVFFFWGGGGLLGMPSSSGVASATSVYRTGLAWGFEICYLGEGSYHGF